MFSGPRQKSTQPARRPHARQRAVTGTALVLTGAIAAGGCLVELGQPLPEFSDSGLTVNPPDTSPPDASVMPPADDGPDSSLDDLPPDDTADDTPPLDDTPPDDAASDDPRDDTEPDDGATPDGAPPGSEGGPIPTGMPEAGGCMQGFEPCDGGCVPQDTCNPPPPPCEETCFIDNALAECLAETCTFVECAEGWIDCDGLVENGCETLFGFEISGDDPLRVERATILEAEDWAGIPVYPLRQPCGDCGISHSGVPEQVAIYAGEAPSDDLQVGFSAAWDPSGLWIRTVVFDDEWVEGIIPSDGSSSVPDPRVYDHVEVVFDGVNPTNYGDPQDHHLFIGIDGDTFDQREPASALDQRVDVESESLGVCRILTAKLSDVYLGGGSPGPFLELGGVYGFSVSYDDFDYNDEQPDVLERQHHLFYLSPGEDYVYGPRDLPGLTLAE